MKEDFLNLFDLSTIFFLLMINAIALVWMDFRLFLIISLLTLGVISLLILIIQDAKIHAFKQVLRRYYIVPLLPLIFSFLHFYVPRVHPDFFDPILIDIDYFIFSFHPTLEIEKLYHPWILTICQLSYSTYYFLPFPLAFTLLKRGRMQDFYYYAFILITAFYISYMGYLLFPAVGPRIFLRDYYQYHPAVNSLIAQVQSALNYLENVQFDAFPSGHTLITLLIIFFQYYHKTSYRHWMLFNGAILIFSTVYLQYHYVIDVMSGSLLAVIIYYIFKPIEKKFHQYQYRFPIFF